MQALSKNPVFTINNKEYRLKISVSYQQILLSVIDDRPDRSTPSKNEGFSADTDMVLIYQASLNHSIRSSS